tara:strand:- start:1653 stop:2096 length:444 start_codon:yes stop_codon:yes gene_type:complete
LWDIFTESLKKSTKKEKIIKDIKINKSKKRSRQLNDLKLGQGVAISKKNYRNLSKGNVNIDDKLDLHGYRELEANNLLEEFINNSFENGKRLLLVITGKGQKGEGVIKKNIINWLNAKNIRNKILAVNHASNKHGGSGALYILLRKF